MNKGSKGAMGELIASAYLLENNYHVFRSLSPSCPFDLVAYQNNVFYRIEVKTLSWLKDLPSFSTPYNFEWDKLLVVNCDTRVVYEFDSYTTMAENIDRIRLLLGLSKARRHPRTPIQELT